MYQIDLPSAATALPAPAAEGVPGYFTDGNPATAEAPTIVPADFLNAVMMELLNILAAVPVAPVKGTNNQVVTAIQDLIATAINTSGASLFTTGDLKLTAKNVADVGWIMLNDGTIGDATSGATTLANASAQNLFTLLWDNFSQANCPVSSGVRGATAADDWAANYTIALPKVLGRALAAAGQGAGLTLRNLGDTPGEENHVLTVNELAAHAHPYTDPTHAHTVPGGSNQGTNGSTGIPGSGLTSAPWPTTSVGVGITIENTGGGAGHNTLQPSVFFNVMIKL